MVLFPYGVYWPFRENVEVFMQEFVAMEHYCRRGDLFCDGWSLRRSKQERRTLIQQQVDVNVRDDSRTNRGKS